ncbi:MAG: hypothetical protein J6C19_00695 [Lachnospiraceae bacterium]|nr:hypothetical protein [Lachnospiraceae bacterium]
MKRKILAGTMALSLVLANSITAFAAPEATEDGGVFDAEYYADNNPDVEAVYGRDFNLLYQHFVAFGAQEGRLPFAVGTDTAAILETAQTENVSQEPAASEEPASDIVLAAEGVEYPITTFVRSEDDNGNEVFYSYTDKVSSRDPREGIEGQIDYQAVYAIKPAKEGYEWVSAGWAVLDGWTAWSWSVDNGDAGSWDDDCSDVENYVDRDALHGSDYANYEVFTGSVSYNGSEYPMIAVIEDNPVGGSVWAMVPEGYTDMYLHVMGSKVENGKIVSNEEDMVTFQLKKY